MNAKTTFTATAPNGQVMTVKTTIAVTHILVTDYLVEGVYEEMGLCRSFELAQKMQAKKEAQYTPYIGRMHIVEVTAN